MSLLLHIASHVEIVLPNLFGFQNNILSGIYRFIELIVANFNLAWFLLIFTLMFRKNLLNLFSKVRSVGYRDAFIDFELEEARNSMDNFIDEEDTHLDQPPVGAGGVPTAMSEEEKESIEVFKMITDDTLLIEQYKLHGDKETVIRIYLWFEERVADTYGLDFTSLPDAMKALKEKSRALYKVFHEIQKIYFLTLEKGADKKLWKISDLINYAGLVRIGLNHMTKDLY